MNRAFAVLSQSTAALAGAAALLPVEADRAIAVHALTAPGAAPPPR